MKLEIKLLHPVLSRLKMQNKQFAGVLQKKFLKIMRNLRESIFPEVSLSIKLQTLSIKLIKKRDPGKAYSREFYTKFLITCSL